MCICGTTSPVKIYFVKYFRLISSLVGSSPPPLLQESFPAPLTQSLPDVPGHWPIMAPYVEQNIFHRNSQKIFTAQNLESNPVISLYFALSASSKNCQAPRHFSQDLRIRN